MLSWFLGVVVSCAVLVASITVDVNNVEALAVVRGAEVIKALVNTSEAVLVCTVVGIRTSIVVK